MLVKGVPGRLLTPTTPSAIKRTNTETGLDLVTNERTDAAIDNTPLDIALMLHKCYHTRWSQQPYKPLRVTVEKGGPGDYNDDWKWYVKLEHKH